MSGTAFVSGVEIGGQKPFELIAFSGQESLSNLFEFRLELITREDATVDPKKLLGAKVKFWWGDDSRSPQFERIGYLRRLVAVGTDYTAQQPYIAEVVPKLWFATLNTKSRMFENKSATDIVSAVLKDYGISLKMDNAKFKREYCLQYGETDFAFISRLLEEEGLCYHFDHKGDTLVISDGLSAASAAKCKTGMEAGEFPTWEHQYDYVTGAATLVDFDFEKPSTKLQSKETTVVKLPDNRSYGHYEFPGGFTEKGRGDSLAKLRMEEREAAYSIANGSSMEYAFYAGGAFSFTKAQAAEEATNFLITAISHSCRAEGYISGGGADYYRNQFTCIPDKVKFRPPRSTAKPRINGLHTAMVVEAEDKMDKYGRVRVAFNWGQSGQAKNETVSCWVRVAQSLAGKKWGALFIPRVDQEVVVSFLDGDPDHPLIIGAVYNGDAMPPYDLPGAWTQSGIKTQSQKGGANDFNELRFDDKKDGEEIYIQAQKDFRRVVKKGDDELTIEKGKRAKTLKEGDETILLEKGKRSVELKEGSDSLLLSKGDLSVEAKKGNISHKLGGGKFNVDAKQGVELKVGGNSIKMDNSGIELKVGSNSVKIAQSGVTVKGVQISIAGQAKAELKSPMTTVKGDGMLTIKGGVVMIN